MYKLVIYSIQTGAQRVSGRVTKKSRGKFYYSRANSVWTEPPTHEQNKRYTWKICKYTIANEGMGGRGKEEGGREENKELNPEENIRVKQKEIPQVVSHNEFIYYKNKFNKTRGQRLGDKITE